MWKRLLYILPLLFGVIGFCAIPFIVGLDDLLQAIGHLGWLHIVLFIGNASGSLLFPAFGWWVLMRAEGIPVPLGTAVQANLMGFPINMVTPSMYLGGEPLKVVYIAKVSQVSTQRVLATIIAAKFQELSGLILAIIAATTFLIWHADYFALRNEAMLVVLMIALVCLCAAIFYVFVRRFKPLLTLIDCVARLAILPHAMSWLRKQVTELGDLIYAVFVHRRGAFIVAQLITCLSSVSIFLRPWIFFLVFPSLDVGFDRLCIIFVLSQVVNTFTFIPGGLGLFEGVMTGYARVSGLGGDKGAAFALVSRISDLTLVIIGCWLLFHYGLTQVAHLRRSQSSGKTTVM